MMVEHVSHSMSSLSHKTSSTTLSFLLFLLLMVLIMFVERFKDFSILEPEFQRRAIVRSNHLGCVVMRLWPLSIIKLMVKDFRLKKSNHGHLTLDLSEQVVFKKMGKNVRVLILANVVI